MGTIQMSKVNNQSEAELGPHDRLFVCLGNCWDCMIDCLFALEAVAVQYCQHNCNITLHQDTLYRYPEF